MGGRHRLLWLERRLGSQNTSTRGTEWHGPGLHHALPWIVAHDQGADGLLEEREDPPPLPRPRRRSERLLDRLAPPLLERLLDRGTFDARDPSLALAVAELEESLDHSPWVAVRACPASALVSC